MTASADLLALPRFERALNTSFDIDYLREDETVARSINALLVNVASRPSPAGYEQFAALFHGPAEPLLPQGTYQFRHAEFGEVMLFMVPVGRDIAHIHYEVCVSRKLED